MATQKASTTAIEVPQMSIGRMEVTLVGDTPLIVHAWSTKAKKEMLDKQMKKAKPGKQSKDPNQDFEDSLYKLGDGGYGFPSVAFKAAAITAVTSVSGVTKVAARQAFHVHGEQTELGGAFDGVKMRMDLVRIRGAEPTMREDMVRIGMGTADIRYRGEFYPWYVVLTVRYNTHALSEGQILNLFNTAGFGVGIGEWRSERDGNHGLFHCATEADLELIAEEEALAKKTRTAKPKRLKEAA